MSRDHVIHVLTVADSLVFIDRLVEEALARDFEVTVVTSPSERLAAFARQHRVRTVAIEMPRRVTPLGDWLALQRLHTLFCSMRPKVVHAHTPKGGLLGTLAAQAAGVSVRIYHMRGLPFVTLGGAKRALLQATERLACASATRVLCQSHSLRETALRHGLVSPTRSEVILQGSNGVDCDGRFEPARQVEAGLRLRARLGIPPAALVVAFVGRLVRDKGVPELVEAFEAVAATRPDAWLLLAGPREERDALAPDTLARLDGNPRIRQLGFVTDSAPVYAASDLVVLPSHREGFPNVPLEAASMGRPVVSTLVDGCRDAVEDGVTGLLVPVADARQLATALAKYLDDGALRVAHGSAGRTRVETAFRRERIAQATVDVYDRELASN